MDPRPEEGGVNDLPSDQDAASVAQQAAADARTRAKSIGEVASPLLAGFSFTNVIFIAMSSDTDNFLLPGAAMISWTVASVAFIASVQLAKYVAEVTLDAGEIARYVSRTDICYHVGVITFLGGFGLALAPQHSSGSFAYRVVASVVAFAACAIEGSLYLTRPWRTERKRRRQASQLPAQVA
jgi:hypothetical protein